MAWDVRKFDEIDSTNTWLLEQAKAGAPEGLVAVADHQSAGRGRLGRRWEAPRGANLLCSVLLRPATISWLSVARVSLAGRDAASETTSGGVVPGLKWPNDLVVETPDGDRKVAGVLAEVDLATRSVVVGIGMNVGWSPPDLPATRLGDGIAPDDVLHALLGSLERWVEAPDGEVLSAYRGACVTLGRRVRVELAEETFEGAAADVNDAGHLLVETSVCLREVAAGDVVHLR